MRESFNSRQIKGYRALLVGAIRRYDNGAEITIDLKTAERLVKILDQAIHIEEDHEPKLVEFKYKELRP